jgi:TolB protein
MTAKTSYFVRAVFTSLLASCLALAAFSARAALNIEIVGSGANQIPIAIAPFRSEESLPQQITSIVSADLTRSGLFKSVDAGGVVPIPFEPEQVVYPTWRARGADALVIGTATPAGDGRFDVRFRLFDVVKQTQLAGFSYTVTAGQLRLTAHKIADVIYEKLTGDPGVFATRITYVMRRGTRYELHVADADGFGAQTILASNEPIISPSWSPEGNRLAYVSFERRKPVVYVQSLTTGQRTPVANFFGSNSAPAWSPDGRRLAVVLTKDGGSQIFMIDAAGRGTAQRLSTSAGIDTEPNFSPDGQWIIFTSDRGGSPQIYRMPATGGQAQRLTFEGSYNVSPRHSPDGKSFTFIRRDGGRFAVAVQDFATRQLQMLTDGPLDESPSFAPNSRMVLYAAEIRGRGILAAVSSDGRVKQRFTESGGDVREPAWGPLINR